MDQQKTDEKVMYVGDSRVRKSKKVQIPQDYTAYPGKSEAFVPNFLLKEWMVGAVFLVGYMALIIAHPSPLGYPADPTNSTFIPMPDWYFLFMYQLLKYPYMSENFVVFGTLIVPGLLFGGLLLAPFLDTGKERRWYKRPIASTAMLLCIVAVFYLTHVSWSHYQHELEARGIVPEHIEREEKLKAGEEVPGVDQGGEEPPAIVAEDSEGYQLYQKATCVDCHGVDLSGSRAAPSLLGVGDKHDRAEIEDIIRNGYNSMGAQYDSNVPDRMSEEEMSTMIDWLAQQTAEADDEAQDGEAAGEESGAEDSAAQNAG